ncbi:MAG: histidine phosphatase family protein [Anaerolineae bacterium]|nr:histidine phosphatase family protein [Anaerolineae bacterium]
MLTIYFSPHMTSTDNEAKRASGYADVPLSDAGRQQSHELGQHYAAYPLVAIFCSDLQRAVDTAQIGFGARGLPIIPDSRLRETDYGDLTQHPTAELDAQFPLRIRTPFPNGESLAMAVQRTGDCLRDALTAYDQTAVLVIGHRATKYGLDFWCGDQTLEDIVATPWEWRDIPIWHYDLHAEAFIRRTL